MAEGDERFGQGFDDVCQTAGLREWQAFGCDEENLHRVVFAKGDKLLSGRFNAIGAVGGASSWGLGTFSWGKPVDANFVRTGIREEFAQSYMEPGTRNGNAG